MAEKQSATLRRILLAFELRRLRTKAQLTQQQVEERADLPRNSLWRYERPESAPTVVTVGAILKVYGLDDEQDPERIRLLEMARGLRTRSRPGDLKGKVPPWFEDVVKMEQEASSISEVAHRLIPGLLQTEQYAREVLSAGILGLDVEALVLARMSRASLLAADPAPEYWVVLCESALHCMVGGRHVMHEQLLHLAEMAQRPKITIQVLTNNYGAHPAMAAPFSILGFAEIQDFGVVSMELPTGGIYRDEPAEVRQYYAMHRHLIKAALAEKESLALIAARAKDLE